MAKRKYLMKVRKSRRSFLGIYLMVLIVIFFMGYINYIGIKPSTTAWVVSIAFIYFSVKYIEYTRIKDWWAITERSIVQSQGLFNKNIREIDFSSISDLDLEQAFFKRILNYGNVNVRLFLNETSIKIINITRPERFIEKLQSLINENRRKKDGLREIS